ncbi:MAG: hypothetical protein HY219_01735 [Candidatus Staskawiczbacteria bacterium]|nr:hypothetical protein [Candidatus Staskawiczbacteria bacterium]
MPELKKTKTINNFKNLEIKRTPQCIMQREVLSARARTGVKLLDEFGFDEGESIAGNIALSGSPI